jgi:polyribonucleotide nucleotidyltransferase
VNVGDKLRVEIADIDKRGKISLVLMDEDAGQSGDGEPAASPETAPADAATASS